MGKGTRRLLVVLVAAEFAGTSPWFATNAVMEDLRRAWGLAPSALGHATSAVQVGFIVGTLLFAALGLADRFPSRRLFLCCGVAAGGANLALLAAGSLAQLVAVRFVTGIALAGVYPVALKIADERFGEDRGHAMGWLVAALVLGTALPHGLRALGADLPWEAVVAAVSALAMAGGAAVGAFAGEPTAAGAARPKRLFVRPAELSAAGVRAAAFGYFGHMWELYAFWAFVPVVVAQSAGTAAADVPSRSFVVVAAGALGCGVGAVATRCLGSARVAIWSLAASGACCVVSPIALARGPLVVAPFLLLWGAAVVADSPQYSALAAAHAPRELVGTTLTLMNAVGFGVTIASIELLNELAPLLPTRFLLLPLALGPLAGLVALRPLLRPWRRFLSPP